MDWNGDAEDFVTWCVETDDVDAFESALETVPNDRWLEVETKIALRLVPAVDMPAKHPAPVVTPQPDDSGVVVETINSLKERSFNAAIIERRRALQV